MVRKCTFAIGALAALTLALGCGETAPQAQNIEKDKPAAKDGDHGHKTGAHGGHIFSIGADNYHVEVRFEATGQVRLYLLGRDEARVQEIEIQNMTAYAQAEGQTESVKFEIKAAPQGDDSPGKTSQFVGTLPDSLRGKPVALTVPMRIAGDRFRPTFTPPRPAAHAGMPAGVARGSEKERELYLTPGGIYSTTDIQANGKTVPSVKFADVSWPHDKKKPGDKVCPITDNKADQNCSWVVNGKTYEFCCSPCLDKFVGWAKNQPGRIKEPGDYVYRE